MILLKKDWSYTLEKNQEENYILSVISGGVAIYEIKIKLTQEEVNKYYENGESYINSLVINIQEFPSKWLARNLNE